MSDWSSDVAARLKRKEEDERLSKQRALLERDILAHSGKTKWNELYQAAVRKSTEFNAEPERKDRLSWTRGTVQERFEIEDLSTRRKVEFSYDPTYHLFRVSCQPADYEAVYDLSVVAGSSNQTFLAEKRSSPLVSLDRPMSIDVETITNRGIEALLGL